MLGRVRRKMSRPCLCSVSSLPLARACLCRVGLPPRSMGPRLAHQPLALGPLQSCFQACHAQHVPNNGTSQMCRWATHATCHLYLRRILASRISSKFVLYISNIQGMKYVIYLYIEFHMEIPLNLNIICVYEKFKRQL